MLLKLKNKLGCFFLICLIKFKVLILGKFLFFWCKFFNNCKEILCMSLKLIGVWVIIFFFNFVLSLVLKVFLVFFVKREIILFGIKM